MEINIKVFIFEHLSFNRLSIIIASRHVSSLSGTQISLSLLVSMIYRYAFTPSKRISARETKVSLTRERERKLGGVSLVGIHRFEPNRFDRSSSKIVAPAQWLFQSVASDRNLPPLPLERHFDVILLDRAEQVISSKATLKACV